MLEQAGSKKKSLELWLRDEFFKSHCKVFKNRPFIWHIWDGRKDGFAALVNYHRLDRAALERMTFTYLGDWIERQTSGVREDVAGAEERLAAAQDLKRRLELILEGEPPYDIYVRWKSLAAQSLLGLSSEALSVDLPQRARRSGLSLMSVGVSRSSWA